MSNGVQDPPDRISRDDLADYLEYVNGQRRDRAEDLAAGALEYARRNRGDAATRPDIPAAWTAAALDAVIAHHKQRRDPPPTCPSSGEVAAIITALRPLIAAAERERIRQMAERNNAVCIGDEGTSCYFADLLGSEGQDHG